MEAKFSNRFISRNRPLLTYWTRAIGATKAPGCYQHGLDGKFTEFNGESMGFEK